MSAITLAQAGSLPLELLLPLANRHGLITGATGTGKTVSLQTLAEGLSRAGVPVFMADIKGDLSGLAAAGCATEKLSAVIAKRKLPAPVFAANNCVFWDLFGEQGHPVRATISDMGPLMLARLFNLNDVQTGVLQLVFKVADDQDLLLLDVKDLRAMLRYVSDNSKTLAPDYGNISAASIGAITRALLNLEQEGGDSFFGEPMLNILDLIQTDAKGRGVINVLAGERLMTQPRIYACFLLWLLAELFEHLPEVGDCEKPKIVFFFDEAHLLFNDAPQALLEKIEQVVRLIRSKGVGIYFVTQNPLDIPDTVLGQLGNRIQHALRAFSPKDQKAVKAAAQTLRVNPNIDTETAITELAVGEALVSFLDSEGRPAPVERAFIVPPGSRLGPLTSPERAEQIKQSALAGIYEALQDTTSAYEKLSHPSAPVIQNSSGQARPEQTIPAEAQNKSSGFGDSVQDVLFGSTGPRGGKRAGLVETAAKTIVRQLASEVGRQLVRGILGSLTGSSRRRR
ncbi:MAG TPA: helicase HerA-like domain-containing protein [Cellvibrionaceae bacterium]